MARTIYASGLALELADDLGLSPALAQRHIVPTLVRLLSDHLAAGDTICLTRFGTFHNKRVGAKRMRVGARNQRTIHIEPHLCPAWLPGQALKARIRAGGTRSMRRGRTTLPDPGAAAAAEAAS